MNKIHTTNDQLVWFGLSISLHMLILGALFVSLKNKPSLLNKPKSKEIAFKVPAPIIFYGQQLAHNKTPGSLAQVPQPQIQKQQKQSSKKPQVVQKIATGQKAIQKPVQNVAAPVKKEPTLADIFNQARKHFSMPQKTNLRAPGDGAGQPLVIREGDLQYYSLWSTFLGHLNDAARFNRVKNPVPLADWVRNKYIKNHIQCGITINKRGDVQHIDVILSSGYEPYDQVCIQDIWSASPFPPLPDQLGKNVARFEVRTLV